MCLCRTEAKWEREKAQIKIVLLLLSLLFRWLSKNATEQKSRIWTLKNDLTWLPVDRTVTHSSLEREVRGSNLGPVKLDTMVPTARHRCDISSKEAVLPGRNNAEMGPANLLQASAYYIKYNERLDLIWSEATAVGENSAFLVKLIPEIEICDG